MHDYKNKYLQIITHLGVFTLGDKVYKLVCFIKEGQKALLADYITVNETEK